MSPRTLVAAVAVAALLGGGAGAGLTIVLVKKGPAGTAGTPGAHGKRGLVGPQGPRGQAVVDASAVQAAVDEDPQAIADSLSGYLDYQDIQQNLDPDPADVNQTLMNLCTDLSFSAAVSSDITAC